MNWLKKILNGQSSEEKLNQYMGLLKEMQVINIQSSDLADAFRLNKSMVADIENYDLAEQKARVGKFDSFLSEHKRDIQSLLKSKMQVDNKLNKLRSDAELKETFEMIDKCWNAKELYKSKKISASLYNDIIQKSTGEQVHYSDTIVVDPEGKLLILHRADENGTGKWCIPGGHVDPGEDHETAAKRELVEETGLKLENPIKKGTYKDDDAFIEYYLFYAPEETQEVFLDSTEHDGHEWIELRDIDKYDFIFNMKDNLKKIFGMNNQDDYLVNLSKAMMAGKITPAFFDKIVKSKNKNYFSKEERKDLAKEGEAMPNGKYPIRNEQDLKDAIRLVGASDMPRSEVEAWIKKRAKALGLENLIPEDWSKEVEKGIDTKAATTMAKESVEEKEKDAVEKSVEGYRLSIDFADLEHAELFKAMVSEYKEQGKLNILGINDELMKSEDPKKKLFKNYMDFLEGVKTRVKNVHWGELDNSKHVYLDELTDELNDYEDKVAEAGQSEFGRFNEGEIQAEEIEVNDPVELCELIFVRTKAFRSKLDSDANYAGEVSWLEDFMATLKQIKYRLQMH